VGIFTVYMLYNYVSSTLVQQFPMFFPQQKLLRSLNESILEQNDRLNFIDNSNIKLNLAVTECIKVQEATFFAVQDKLRAIEAITGTVTGTVLTAVGVHNCVSSAVTEVKDDLTIKYTDLNNKLSLLHNKLNTYEEASIKDLNVLKSLNSDVKYLSGFCDNLFNLLGAFLMTKGVTQEELLKLSEEEIFKKITEILIC